MQRFVLLLTSVVTLHASCTAAHAQLVQVRPGFVKAPFVQVHKYADGSSYVRAPFVSVHSPGRHRLHPNVPSLGDDPRHMTWDGLCTSLNQAADQLDAQLLGFPTGAYWKNYLATAEIRDVLRSCLDGPPPEDVRPRLQQVVHAYAWVADTPELSAITRLSGFQSVHVLLHELLIPAEVRLRRELIIAADHLYRSLSRLHDGAQWRDYLALGFAMDQEADHVAGPNRDHVAKVLRRYDSINADDEIAQLPGFRATHEHLKAYLQLLDSQASEYAVKEEELPLPAASL